MPSTPPPDALTYFVIILGGFGAVWAFRKVTGRSGEPLADFEYVGFSAVWGVLVLAAYSWVTRGHPEQIALITQQPVAAGPAMFVVGAAFGACAALILIALNSLRMSHRL